MLMRFYVNKSSMFWFVLCKTSWKYLSKLNEWLAGLHHPVLNLLVNCQAWRQEDREISPYRRERRWDFKGESGTWILQEFLGCLKVWAQPRDGLMWQWSWCLFSTAPERSQVDFWFWTSETGEPLKRIINRDNLFGIFLSRVTSLRQRESIWEISEVKYLPPSILKIIQTDSIHQSTDLSPSFPGISAPRGRMFSQLKDCGLPRGVSWTSRWCQMYSSQHVTLKKTADHVKNPKWLAEIETRFFRETQWGTKKALQKVPGKME